PALAALLADRQHRHNGPLRGIAEGHGEPGGGGRLQPSPPGGRVETNEGGPRRIKEVVGPQGRGRGAHGALSSQKSYPTSAGGVVVTSTLTCSWRAERKLKSRSAPRLVKGTKPTSSSTSRCRRRRACSKRARRWAACASSRSLVKPAAV